MADEKKKLDTLFIQQHEAEVDGHSPEDDLVPLSNIDIDFICV